LTPIRKIGTLPTMRSTAWKRGSSPKLEGLLLRTKRQKSSQVSKKSYWQPWISTKKFKREEESSQSRLTSRGRSKDHSRGRSVGGKRHQHGRQSLMRGRGS